MNFLIGKSRKTPAKCTTAASTQLSDIGSLATAATERARNTATSKDAPLLVVKQDSDDEEMVIMERVEHGQEAVELEQRIVPMYFSAPPNDHFSEVINVPIPESKGATIVPSPPVSSNGDDINSTSISEEAAFALMSEGPIPNPEALVMGQLIQWKFSAEEGPIALRIPAVLGGLALMVTTLIPLVFFDALNVSKSIIAFYVVNLGSLICIVDGRFNYARDPLGVRAKLRNAVVRHVNVFRLVWGRGVLYMIAGLLNFAQNHFVCFYSGGFMLLLGMLAFVMGSRSSRNLATLRSSLCDENFLWLEFLKNDRDCDGHLSPREFAQFISDLGLEWDDLYTLKAFTTIDTDRDQKVTFREFVRWWSQVRFDGAIKTSHDHQFSQPSNMA
jgi:hypothetical protein